MTMVVMELTRAEGGDELATYGLNVCSVAIGRLSSNRAGNLGLLCVCTI